MTPSEHVETIKNLWDEEGEPRPQTLAYAVSTLIQHVSLLDRYRKNMEERFAALEGLEKRTMRQWIVRSFTNNEEASNWLTRLEQYSTELRLEGSHGGAGWVTLCVSFFPCGPDGEEAIR